MKTGDRIICIDDSGWLVPDPGFEHLAPVKGCVYVVRELTRSYIGNVLMVSLREHPPGSFYRACRFRPMAPLTNISSPVEEKPCAQP